MASSRRPGRAIMSRSWVTIWTRWSGPPCSAASRTSSSAPSAWGRPRSIISPSTTRSYASFSSSIRRSGGAVASRAGVPRRASRHRFAHAAVEARLEPAQPAAAGRDGRAVGQLDRPAVAGALESDDAVEVDDVAAVHPREAGGIEPRLDLADGKRAKQLVAPVEDVGVVRIGVDRDDVVDRDVVRCAVPLD